MAKIILFNGEAREALKRGVDAVANAVKVTIGPRGRNVVIEKGFGGPTVTNDGVTIAKEITLADKFENMGAEIVKEVATKTNDKAGDGTTTSVVLTQALVEAGFRRSEEGGNSMALRRGIEAATEDALKALKSLAKPIKTDAEVRQVATISAESEEIGGIIAETIRKIGKDGVVTVEESPSFGVESEVVEGLEIDKGYVSAYMVTDAERMEAKYKDIPVLLTDRRVSSVKEVLPFLEKLAATGKKELMIIADDIEGEALTTFVLNKLRGGFNILGVKAPGFGERKKELLEDIAVTIGAKVVSETVGLTLENAELSVLGRANVIATKDKTVLVGGKGKKAEIEKRVAALKAQREAAKGKYEQEQFDQRIGKLAGGVAVLRVGAATETEMKYLKLKIEDAVNATKAAIAEGIVVGGGGALAKVSKKLEEKFKASKDFSEEGAEANDFRAGYLALIDALREPLRQIARNAGRDEQVVVSEVLRGEESSGYDALKDEFVPNMFKEGIIDPVKVERTALENASSAVAILLTTEVAIAEEPEKKPAPTSSQEEGY
jgi:chaperonin GroEL